MKKALIVNDTSYENHHGCEIVIKNIHKLLEKNNIKVIATNPTGVDWSKNRKFIRSIYKADIVIINGEGTLHHAQPRAKKLITIGKYIKEKHAIPVVLINATYQDNNATFIKYLKYFDLIYVRDRISKFELLEIGIPSNVVPDLTYYNVYDPGEKSHSNMIGLTDSVDIKLSEKLYNFSTQSALYSYMPLLTNEKTRANFQSIINYCKFYTKKSIKYLLFRAGYALNHSSVREIFYISGHKVYIKEISNLKLVITGRFHVLCFALQTLTPFIVINSIYHKYEGMLDDIGIGSNRIVDNIDSDFASYCKFEKYELEMIARYLDEAPKKIEKMFQDIASIV
jgi:polysaccharide pyruvyl transferase WcaK-like protein